MSDYDKELINSRIIEVCDYYLSGEGRREGYKRRIWQCPGCDGDKFAANSDRRIAGCLSTSCEVPQTKDAVGLIAYFEGLDLSGGQFVRCLKKGYDILGIPEPEDEQDSGGKSRPRSFTPGEKSPAPKEPQTPQQNGGGHEDRQNQEPPATEARSATTATVEPEAASEFSQAAATQEAIAPQTYSYLPDSGSNGDTEAEGGEEPKSVEEPTADTTDVPTVDPEEHRELVDRVYRAMLELCPLAERDRKFWHSRGVTDETMTEAGLGSLWRERCREVLRELEERFGREALTSVPGFYVSGQGRLQTNLYDDYTLIPYHDRDGYITMVQGRVPGEPKEGQPKYKAPVNSGLHLYVYPRYLPEQTMAFVEGAVGAIVAAQARIPVAAIAGYQHYRLSGSLEEGDKPLPEHAKTDFGGRRVLYIPDEDVKESVKDSVQAEAPKAARFLIERHNGKPLLARLPEGHKDLDEWLLSVDEVERVPAFASLMPAAITPEQWEGTEPLEPERGNGTASTMQQSQKAQKDSPKKQKATGEVRQSVVGEDSSTGADEHPEDGGESNSSHNQNGGEGSDKEHQPQAPRVKTPAPQPRAYTPIPKTNFGELMVALIYALMAVAACLTLMLYAAPKWSLTGFLTAVPVWITVVGSIAVAAAVLLFVRRKLYQRRWLALRNHLAGGRD